MVVFWASISHCIGDDDSVYEMVVDMGSILVYLILETI